VARGSEVSRGRVGVGRGHGGSERAIAALIEHNITPWMVTGDAEPVARAVAEQVGIDPDHVVAGVMPEDKVAIVARLQGEGHRVAMAGDGVNDAAALATADLGIAMGSGADVAMEASDLTIVSGALMGTVDAIRLSRSTLGTIKVNLFWAFGYNVAAIPLAAVGLLTPLIGGLAMAASSVLVVLNSLRLRRFVRAEASGWSRRARVTSNGGPAPAQAARARSEPVAPPGACACPG